MAGLSRRGMLLTSLAGGMAAGLAPASGHARVSAQSVLAAPTGASIILEDMIRSGVLSSVMPDPKFSLWYSIDDLRAAVVSGKCKFFSTPTNVPANLAVRGLPVKLLCILGWAHLSVISASPEFHRFSDLAGRKLLGFFPHDMPDLVFRATANMEGVSADRDFSLSYVSSPVEAAQMLVAGCCESAILSEPLASASILRAAKAGRKLYRAIDIGAVWRAHHHGQGIPMVGVAVHTDLLKIPHFTELAWAGLQRSYAKIRNNHAYAADIAAQVLHVNKSMFLNAFPNLHLDLESAGAVKPELVAFYKTLLELEPRALGGHLPGDGFYLDV